MRVREMLERSRRSLADGTARQRLEGSTRQLLQRSRETVAQLVGPLPQVPQKQPATGQVSSQEVLAGVCASIALRDLNLVDALLQQLEKMEADEEDPDTLAKLYKLDHLATRLRRNGENLRVLAGRDAGTIRDETASLVDVVRAAVSSIEHYQRVELGRIAALGVVGFAADDVSRLLAELLDNATTHSPPTTTVAISAHLTEQGSVMVRVEDAGIGLPAARLSALNERLASSPTLDRNAVQHMGLAVVRRLASRHNVRVWLARRAPHGTTASVLLPASLVQDSPSKRFGGQQQPREDWPKPSSRPWTSSTPGASGGSRMTGTIAQPGASAPDGGPATTVNGLPKRIPRSLKDPAGQPGAGAQHSGAGTNGAPQRPSNDTESHQRLLADLDGFAEGEQAAHDERARTSAEGQEE